jgi:hypothetical protein
MSEASANQADSLIPPRREGGPAGGREGNGAASISPQLSAHI